MHCRISTAFPIRSLSLNFALLLFLCSSSASAETVVFERIHGEDAAGANRLLNAGFEEGDAAPVTSWHHWQQGYTLADGRNGTRGVRCTAAEYTQQTGATQVVHLNQTAPAPIVASAWSRAEQVDGSPNTGYAVYLDIKYADGTDLWGQTAAFSTGTHDWERREVFVMPEKPIASLSMHLLFRGHTGTVWFDDATLAELDPSVRLFEEVPVKPTREKLPINSPAWCSSGMLRPTAISLHRTGKRRSLRKSRRASACCPVLAWKWSRALQMMAVCQSA